MRSSVSSAATDTYGATLAIVELPAHMLLSIRSFMRPPLDLVARTLRKHPL